MMKKRRTILKMIKLFAVIVLSVVLSGCIPDPTPGPAGSKTLACTDENYMYSFHYTGDITWDNGKYTFMDADTNKVRNVYNFACYEVQE